MQQNKMKNKEEEEKKNELKFICVRMYEIKKKNIFLDVICIQLLNAVFFFFYSFSSYY